MSEPAYPLAFPERTGERAWPAQGNWTYDDYRLLPDDGRRFEVIRGHLYGSAAPSVEHQSAVGELYLRLKLFLRERDLGNAYVAPLDIILPREIATPVQPDLVVFLKENQVPSRAPHVRGVPDLLAEVLSPSTRRLDTETRLPAYRDAGVPEVWLADPLARKITVHVLSEDGTRYLELCRGGMGEAVSSRVLPGLRVDVGEIFVT